MGQAILTPEESAQVEKLIPIFREIGKLRAQLAEEYKKIDDLTDHMWFGIPDDPFTQREIDYWELSDLVEYPFDPDLEITVDDVWYQSTENC